MAEWIPALVGVAEKLERGARSRGCRLWPRRVNDSDGASVPNSTFIGFDYHDESIEQARLRAAEAGVARNATFETAAAKDFHGNDYDLVCMFDYLHDMGDPVGAAKHVHETLADDGAWMIVEPFANDSVEANLNPVGRVFYGASTVMLHAERHYSQEVGL